MSDSGKSKPATDSAPLSLDGAVRRAEEALAALKAALHSGEAGELGEKVSATASALLREGEELIENNETLKTARKDVSGAVQRNPLAALAIAFGAGLLLALLTRG
jgi:hypothetical protein